MEFTKESGKILTVLLAVLFGVYAVTQILGEVNLIVSVISLTFGLVAIIWTYMAKQSLSKGTMLREYVVYFFYSLVLIFLLSILDLVTGLFRLEGVLISIRYFLLILAYVIFFLAANKIFHLGKQFGFKPQVKRMKLKNVGKKLKLSKKK